MTQTIRRFITAALIAGTLGPLGAASPRAVATTEWSAAFCRAAGLEDVRVLAPSALQHPPDYELKPSDIPAIMEADIIVFGGYEGMMERIRSHVAGSDTAMLQIETVYDPELIEKSVRAIAAAAGTEVAAEANLTVIREAWAEARRMADEAGLSGAKTIAHRFQAPFAGIVGLDVVTVIGPVPPGPRLIAEAAGSGAVLILDNWHNPVSAPIGEILKGAGTVELINFPGRGGTVTLDDVILYNARLLAGAAGR